MDSIRLLTHHSPGAMPSEEWAGSLVFLVFAPALEKLFPTHGATPRNAVRNMAQWLRHLRKWPEPISGDHPRPFVTPAPGASRPIRFEKARGMQYDLRVGPCSRSGTRPDSVLMPEKRLS